MQETNAVCEQFTTLGQQVIHIVQAYDTAGEVVEDRFESVCFDQDMVET